MRTGVAQMRPAAGDVEANLRRHHDLLDLAASAGVQLLCFPELSLTGYEPRLAARLVVDSSDSRLATLQDSADANGISIAVGLPAASESGTGIGMVVFRPHGSPVKYSKRLLHADELPWFVPGGDQLAFDMHDHRISPAICYESLQDVHAREAAELGADIYMASVAKSADAVKRAFAHYPGVARRHAMTVLMANFVGPCDDFLAAGRSSIWNSRGEPVISLDGEREGIAVFDTSAEEVGAYYL